MFGSFVKMKYKNSRGRAATRPKSVNMQEIPGETQLCSRSMGEDVWCKHWKGVLLPNSTQLKPWLVSIERSACVDKPALQSFAKDVMNWAFNGVFYPGSVVKHHYVTQTPLAYFFVR